MDEATHRLIFNSTLEKQVAATSAGTPQAIYIPSDDPIVYLDLAKDATGAPLETKKVKRQRDQIPPVKSFVAREPNPFGEAIDWAFRCYDVTLPDGQEGKVFQDSIYLFNVLVALEWHPDEEYMAQLESAFHRASDLLFDITDGWMAFGQVVFGGSELMDCADIQIMASNRLLSRAWVGAMHPFPEYPNDEKYMPIRAGRGLWNENRRGIIPWEETESYRTLIHEWGHYALTLTDEYLEKRQLVPPEQVRRVEASDLTLLQAPITTVVMPTVYSIADSIMSTTEGTSELVSAQWDKLSTRFPRVTPGDATRKVSAGPRRVPMPLPRIRRQGTLAGSPNSPTVCLPAWANLRERLAQFDLPDDIKPDHCWVYVLRGLGPDKPDSEQVIAQGTLEARSAQQPFPLLGAQPGDSVLMVCALRDASPQVLRAQIPASGEIEDWTSVGPTGFPSIDIVPQPTDAHATLASISVRLNGASSPAPDRVSIFPLGHTSPFHAARQKGAEKSVWASKPQDVSTLDGHVLARWGKAGEQMMISSFSQGGGPATGSPNPANPISAGSSDGGAMLFFDKGGEESSAYSHIRIVTTIAHGLDGTPPNGRERGYAYSMASNQALPPELLPTLVMYYDPFVQYEEQLLLGGDLRICRLVNGEWKPLPTYLPPGYRFAVTPLDRQNGGALVAANPNGPRVEYYKVCWVPRRA
jgi:hypothetical protein